MGVVSQQEPLHISVPTLVAAVEDARESVGAFEVEKGGNRQDQEQADQQCSQEKRGRHAWPSCSKTQRHNRKQMMRNMMIILLAAFTLIDTHILLPT